MPAKKSQTLLVALALTLAVFAPLWHSTPHHGFPRVPGAHPPPVEGARLAAADGVESDAGGACPVCLHERLLNQSCVETVAAVSAPASTTRPRLESEVLPVSHRSLPPGARAPPAC
jgi:hypothetical protein